MSVYYQDESVTLYHGSCLEIDEWLEADVLVTDPPYGVAGGLTSGGKKRRGAGAGDSKRNAPTHDREVVWDKTLEVRNAALAMWGDRPAAVFATARRLDDRPAFREVPLIWDKGEAVGMGDTSFPWRPSYELVYVSGPGWAGRRTTAILRYPQGPHDARNVGHPTPKPLGLMSDIIAKAPAGVIADPFAGSGSTLIAARNMGRRAIGVEMDERYCAIIASRLDQGVLDFEGMGA